MMFKSAMNNSPQHWETAYDEKYYNNLGLTCFIAVVTAASSASSTYYIWSPDVTDLICSGTTIDEAKTDFWFHIMDRIYNRSGGIYLINSDLKKYDPTRILATIKRNNKECAVTLLPDTVVVLLLPNILPRN